MSSRIVRVFGIPAVAVLGSVAVAASPAGANPPNGGNQKPNSYVQHNLVSDLAGKADQMDATLVNPWGLAQGPPDAGMGGRQRQECGHPLPG